MMVMVMIMMMIMVVVLLKMLIMIMIDFLKVIHLLSTCFTSHAGLVQCTRDFAELAMGYRDTG